jgi:hypothetical protein
MILRSSRESEKVDTHKNKSFNLFSSYSENRVNFLFRKDNSVAVLDEWVEWARWFMTNLEWAHSQLTHAHFQLSMLVFDITLTLRTQRSKTVLWSRVFDINKALLRWFSQHHLWVAFAVETLHEKNLAFNLSQTLLLIHSFFLRQNQTMIRKLSANELHRIVENNEFVTDAHRNENEVQQIKNSFTKRYLRNQNTFLKLWKASVNRVNNVS